MRNAFTIIAALVSMLGAGSATAQVEDYFTSSVVEGAWSDPAKPGQGLFIDSDAERRILFVGWFTFASDESGAQRWLTAQLGIEGALASGPLFATRGGRLDTAPDERQETVEVGTMTIDFLACDRARVSYSITTAGSNESGKFEVTPLAASTNGGFTCGTRTKLRLPQAAPTLSETEYQALANRLFVASNFGQYQGAGASAPQDIYLHDGLDIGLPNGTPIYALEAGIVRNVQNLGTSGDSVTVESDRRPGEAWVYVHIVSAVTPGTRVAAGTRLGTVQFVGIEHLHLTRAKRLPGRSTWRFEDLLTVNPAGWFDIPDAEPPVIEPNLWFMRDGTNTVVAQGNGAKLFGDVDIVAGMRDPGVHARTLLGTFVFGDRQTVAWVEYTIEGQGRFERVRAYDFNLLGSDRPTGSVWSMAPWARVLYQPPSIFEAVRSNPQIGYYNLSNGDGGGYLDLDDAARTWRTGTYPKGTYVVTVRAADFAGNIAVRSNTVEVDNG